MGDIFSLETVGRGEERSNEEGLIRSSRGGFHHVGIRW